MLQDGIDGTDHARIVGWQEPDLRDQEQAGIEIRRAVRLHERVALRIVALGADLRVNRIARLLPTLDRAIETEGFGVLDRPIECHPGHHLRIGEMAPRTADFPNAFIGVAPARLQEMEQCNLYSP